MAKKGKSNSAVTIEEEMIPLNIEQQRILNWLKKVRFKKTLLGGVDEADVWKKLGELNSMYNAALVAERVRYDALLKQAKASKDTNNIFGGGV